MFTVPLCLPKDPGGSDKGAFERGNGLTMEDNDLYSSWETGNVCQQATKNNVQLLNTSCSSSFKKQCKLVSPVIPGLFDGYHVFVKLWSLFVVFPIFVISNFNIALTKVIAEIPYQCQTI